MLYTYSSEEYNAYQFSNMVAIDFDTPLDPVLGKNLSITHISTYKAHFWIPFGHGQRTLSGALYILQASLQSLVL